MRVRRLDLLAYGPFTNRTIELIPRTPDLHIIFGTNEAGKSSTLSAIEDFLFGIPQNSPNRFVHPYDAMRIGCVLEANGQSLETIRRKGRNNTLLTANGLPIQGGDGAMRPFLANADRGFFERMFSLDHQRLQKGGQEILNSKDDIGRMLFAAGTGIAELHQTLESLNAEASSLWAPRNARRKYHAARDNLNEAESARLDASVSVRDWSRLKQAYASANQDYEKVKTAYESKTAERNRLARIRRVYPDIQRKQQLERELEGLVDVVPLPGDAAALLDEAEARIADARARTETYTEQLKQAKDDLAGLTPDDVLLRRAVEARRLVDQRIKICSEREDLPKRESELQELEVALRVHAQQLNWDDTDITVLEKQVAEQRRTRRVNNLLRQQGALETQKANGVQALAAAMAKRNVLKKELAAVASCPDTSRLAATIQSIRVQGDLTGYLNSAVQNAATAQQQIGHLLNN